MKKVINLKNAFVKRGITSFILSLVVSVFAFAQEPFEGEIVYQTYENYPRELLNLDTTCEFNGVHRYRAIMKDCRMHIIDETTGIHQLYDDDRKTYFHYCEHTKVCLDDSYGKYQGIMFSDNNRTIDNGGFVSTVNISSNFAKTDDTKILLGHNCVLYQGNIDVKNSSDAFDMTVSHNIKAYFADDIVAPKSYKFITNGLDSPNIALSLAWKSGGLHLDKVGEGSTYIEMTVLEIKPYKVSDDEFSIPSGYKMIKYEKNEFNSKSLKQMKAQIKNMNLYLNYYKDIKKKLEELGIINGDRREINSSVNYKTEGEWDF